MHRHATGHVKLKAQNMSGKCSNALHPYLPLYSLGHSRARCVAYLPTIAASIETSETEHNRSIRAVEDSLYLSDEYRATTAPIPFPLPLSLEPAPEYLAKELDLDAVFGEALNKTLQNHSIASYQTLFYLQSKPGYPKDGDIKVPALHIQIDTTGQDRPKECLNAIRDIKRLLESYDMPSVEVELYDPRRCKRPTLLAIPPGDPHIRLYEQHRQEIVGWVHKQLGSSWRSISLYGLRTNPFDDKIHYAVVIVVDPLAQSDWASLCTLIQTKLNASKAFAEEDIEVQFLPGSCVFASPVYDPQNELANQEPGRCFATDLPHLPGVGASIGVDGERGGGTLGGYMTLKVSGKTYHGFLTASHLAEPSASNTASAEIEKYKQHGVAITDDPAAPTRSRLHWMASSDIEATKTDIDQQIVKFKEVREVLLPQIEQRDAAGCSHRAQDVQLRYATDQLQRLISSKSICEKMPIAVGSVLFATGQALSPDGRILDTAFVQIPEGEPYFSLFQAANNLPADDSRGLYKRLPEDYGLSEYYARPKSVTGVGQLHKGQWYFKIGRSTDITAGICHGTEAYVQLKSKRSHYDTSWVKGDYEDPKYTEEYVILSGALGKKGQETTPFCKAGDSGALIIDGVGQVVAQLFGYVHGYCELPPEKIGTEERKGINAGNFYGAEAGLVTPIGKIIEAVHGMTGGGVLDVL